jgi:hypothetical protein
VRGKRVMGVPEIRSVVAWKAAPIKAFCDVTLLQTKVIPELRKRMPVGHL